jgi:methylenetetrahydrofolate reductase (NADPH)
VPRIVETPRTRAALAELMANISYEVMPFKRTEDSVVAHVPRDIPITITVTETKGIDATLDLASRLAARGYAVNPHLPARQIRDEAEVRDLVQRMQDTGIERVFVIGGDSSEPAGKFPDAVTLLRALEGMGRPLKDIGISGYPEGHAKIPATELHQALEAKAIYASRIVTQMCFHAQTTVDWAARIAARGIAVPVIVGVPGPVSRQKLVRIAAGIGLGRSARFLQEQHGMWRVLAPGGFNPRRLVRRVASLVPSSPTHIEGLRVFTFNEIAKTEEWRRSVLATLPATPRSHVATTQPAGNDVREHRAPEDP